jgi:hypothetical protein
MYDNAAFDHDLDFNIHDLDFHIHDLDFRIHDYNPERDSYDGPENVHVLRGGAADVDTLYTTTTTTTTTIGVNTPANRSFPARGRWEQQPSATSRNNNNGHHGRRFALARLSVLASLTEEGVLVKTAQAEEAVCSPGSSGRAKNLHQYDSWFRYSLSSLPCSFCHFLLPALTNLVP